VLLQANANTHLIRVSMSSIANKLRPYVFLRIHGSVLVNTSLVEELEPPTRRDVVCPGITRYLWGLRIAITGKAIDVRLVPNFKI
jgi:hypothetical protein